MAKRIKKHQKKKPGRKPQYPWAKWFKQASNGYSLRLEQATDFQCSPESMARQARHAAKQLDLGLSITVEESSIVFSQVERG